MNKSILLIFGVAVLLPSCREDSGTSSAAGIVEPKGDLWKDNGFRAITKQGFFFDGLILLIVDRESGRGCFLTFVVDSDRSKISIGATPLDSTRVKFSANELRFESDVIKESLQIDWIEDGKRLSHVVPAGWGEEEVSAFLRRNYGQKRRSIVFSDLKDIGPRED